jgi:NitT/TauT family transport system substrate-binding protein
MSTTPFALTRAAFLPLAATLVAGYQRAASAQSHFPLRLGTVPIDSGAEPFYGLEQGFFAKHGLDLTVQKMNSGPAIIAAVVSGSLDVGFSNLFSTITAVQHGIPLIAVAPAAMHVATSPAEALIVMKDSPIRGPKDVAGKTLAVIELQGIAHLSAQAWVDDGGGNSSTVKFLELPNRSMLAALEEGRIDVASVASSDYPLIGTPASTVRILGDPFNTISSRFLASAWIAARPWAAANADVVGRFAAAMQETAQWANTHHEESGAILMKESKVTPEGLRSMQRFRMSYGEAMEPQLIQPVIAMEVRYGAIPKPFPATDLIAPTKR